MSLKVEIAEPSGLFKPFIRYYKYVEADITGLIKVVPNNSVELYFNYTHINLFSNKLYDLYNPKVHLAGYHGYSQQIFTEMTGTDRNGGFVIVFNPLGFYNLFGVRAADFSKYCIQGDLVFTKDINHLWEKLHPFRSADKMKEITEQFLFQYALKARTGNNLIDKIVRYMEICGGVIGVSQICHKFDVSVKWLERHCRDGIGLSPKEILQVCRINKAINMIREMPESDLTQIAYLSGYYDQSHFNREIKRVTEFQPGDIHRNKSVSLESIHNVILIKNQ